MIILIRMSNNSKTMLQHGSTKVSGIMFLSYHTYMPGLIKNINE